jgi:ankyrin repeat protein
MPRSSLARILSVLTVVLFGVCTAAAEQADNVHPDDWTVDNSAGFPVWIAINNIGDAPIGPSRGITAYIQPGDFTEANIVKAFILFAAEYPAPDTLFMAAYSDPGIVQQIVDRRGVGVGTHFPSTPEGHRAARNWDMKTQLVTIGSFRAQYWRFPDGREWIDLSPDPDQDHLKKIDLKHPKPDYTGETQPDLFTAAACGDAEKVQALLNAGASVDSELRPGWTPLAGAAWNGQITIVKLMLERGVKQETKDGALTSAACDGGTELVDLLLDNGANVNARTATDDNGFGDSALILASQRGHLRTVEALLSRGARVNQVNRFGETALMLASLAGHAEIVRVLLQNGANPNARDVDGATALIVAANDYDLAKTLVDSGADLSVKDKQGMTALMRSIQSMQRNKEDGLVAGGAGSESIAPARALLLAAPNLDDNQSRFKRQEGYGPDGFHGYEALVAAVVQYISR